MASKRPDTELIGELLGYHLGLSDAPERARAEAAFETRSELEAATATLERILSPLDADTVRVPADLTDRILRRVELSEKTLTFPSATASEAASRGAGRGGSSFSMRELLSLAAAIALFVGVFIPGYQSARMAAQRLTCGSNLQYIGQGMTQYSADNAGQGPSAGPVPAGAPWNKLEGSNARHVYRLVPGRYVPPTAFVCPEQDEDRILEHDSPESLSNFPDPRNNSYSTQIIIRRWWPARLGPLHPFVADMTPLVDAGRRLVSARHTPLNSPSHRQPGGQNVLYGDLSVQFQSTPFAGPQNDDIYRLNGINEYSGFERPEPGSTSDAFLIP